MIKYLFGLCTIFVLTGPTKALAAGAFFDDFDFFANQAAFDAQQNAWHADAPFTTGTLSTSNALGLKSLQCQQQPTESRPTTQLGKGGFFAEPATGRLDLWFFDNGEDIKSFDIAVTNGAIKASVGLRDTQSGSATNYVCDRNGTLTDTGIERTSGWHLVQFAVNGTVGTTVQIDKQDFPDNTIPALLAAMDLTIFTNLGSTADANLVWIDSVNWREGDSFATLPADARVEFIEHFESGISAWAPMTGTAVADLHFNTDGGSNGSPSYIDVFDGGGARGFEGSIANKVRFHGNYRLGFDYRNHGGTGWDPWANLTVTMNGSSSVNLGSAEQTSFLRAQTGTAIPLTPSSIINIQVTGSSAPNPGYVRFDGFYLILDEFITPVTAVDTWQLY